MYLYNNNFNFLSRMILTVFLLVDPSRIDSTADLALKECWHTRTACGIRTGVKTESTNLVGSEPVIKETNSGQEKCGDGVLHVQNSIDVLLFGVMLHFLSEYQYRM